MIKAKSILSPVPTFGVFFFLMYLFFFVNYFFTGIDYVDVISRMSYTYKTPISKIFSYNVMCFMGFLIGCWISNKKKISKYLFLKVDIKLKNRLYRWYLILFLLTFLVQFAIFSVAAGDIANNAQIGGLYTLVQIHIFYSSIFCISLFYLTNKQQRKIVFITSFLYVFLIFINGVRSPALELLVIYLFYYILNYKINYKHLFFGFLGFIFLNLMSDLRQGRSLVELYYESEGIVDFLQSYIYFEYALVMINIEAEALAAYNLFDSNNFLYGFTLIGALFGSVPFYSLFGLSEVVFYFMNPALDIAYEWLPNLKGTVGLGSALPGEFYMNFGFFGSLLFIPIGFLLNQLYKGFVLSKEFKDKILLSILYPLILVKTMLLLRNGFATSVKGFLYLYLIIFIIIIFSNIKLYKFHK